MGGGCERWGISEFFDKLTKNPNLQKGGGSDFWINIPKLLFLYYFYFFLGGGGGGGGEAEEGE